MKKTEMLKKNYEFRRVLSCGKYYSGKYIEIYILPNKYKKNMLGIAISKKIANSVKRNKIKRLIRENYRLIEENINVGYNVIILWKKKVNIELANFTNIKNDIKEIFIKSNMFIKGD